jgi:hypothetical protein
MGYLWSCFRWLSQWEDGRHGIWVSELHGKRRCIYFSSTLYNPLFHSIDVVTGFRMDAQVRVEIPTNSPFISVIWTRRLLQDVHH